MVHLIQLHYQVFYFYLIFSQIIISKENFKVYSWGYNEFGQLGLGHNKNQIIPTNIDQLNDEKIKRIFVGGYHCFCLNGNFNSILSFNIE